MAVNGAVAGGMIEATDWDLSTRVLTGLQLAGTPHDARQANNQRYTERFPDSKVQHELKTIAVRLYNHQKMTKMFQENVSDGKNTLAYLLCASYEPSPSATPERGGRPRLRNCTPLPLAYWDLLYYAICAEIRKMYETLQQVFGYDFESGGTVLHNAGPEGTSGPSRLPISAVGLAGLLEDMWTAITDYRLVGALDLAVRVRHAQDQEGHGGANDDDENIGGIYVPNGDFGATRERSVKHVHDESCHCVAVADGLLDVNNLMAPDEIIEMIWAKQAIDRRRKSGRSSEDQTLLARCRAEVREVSIQAASSHQRKEITTFTASCNCGTGCYCRELCDLQVDECGCAFMRGQIRELVSRQAKVQDIAQGFFGTPELPLPHNMLGAITNDVAQLQVAAMMHAEPYTVQACYAASEAGEKLDREMLLQHRKRTNTNNSELAYVPPPRTPSRAKKDAYPLGFYGDSSGQRYPTFRGNTGDAPPPVYGASFYSATVPKRKPVPRSDLYDDHERTSGQVTYPAIPPSESQGLFAQSFPAAAAGNPRNPDAHEDAAIYADLTEEAHNAIRPFSDEPTMYGAAVTQSMADVSIVGHRPNIFTANTSPDVISVPKARTKALDLAKPIPPLPDLDFIAPRPALKQRYVSAGGNAKLAERQEITGPVLATQVTTQSTGSTILKEDLFKLLNNPDFVRDNFGEEAVGKMSMSASERPSIDSSPSPSRSQRGSGIRSRYGSGQGLLGQRDSKISLKGDKRERTDSGSSGSGRFGKLKRVFSRKNSECEPPSGV